MIIMKFGGTSVGDADRIARVAALVKTRKLEKPLVVVSAVGGMTDLLIEGGLTATRRGAYPNSILKKIRGMHDQISRALHLGEDFSASLHQELSDVFKNLAHTRKFTPRAQDLVASFGERISARFLAAYLQYQGVGARAFDSWEVGFITTSDFTRARLLPRAQNAIKNHLSKINTIPVITGFIGKNKLGHVTTLGRGGSDFTASLLGAALEAKRVEIWTDVSGIMTADPRLVANARPIPSVTFREAAELSAFGAKVLHPKTIEPAMNKNIPVLVKNTFRPKDAGTVIVSKRQKKEGLKAVTFKKGITSLNLYSTGMLEARGFLAKIFDILQKHGMSVDVVTTSEVNVSLTLDNSDGLHSALAELGKFAEVRVDKNRAIVCVVGEGLKETPGIAGKAFHILGQNGINIEMISQGASQINLTCVVDSIDAEKTVRLLHHAFFESC